MEAEKNTINHKRPRVLLVDDDSDQLFVLSTLLDHENYEVIPAESGKSALQALESRPVDIVITDICMPEMNGLQLATQVRKMEGHRNIPIVLMTAGLEPVDFSRENFKADALFLKKQIRETLLPFLNNLDRQQEILQEIHQS